VFLGHGAPILLDDELWLSQLKHLALELPEPREILIISAHWQERPATLSAIEPPGLVYDFWGFPSRYYQLTYPAKGSRRLCSEVASLLGSVGFEVNVDQTRGLDHGAWVPLMAMYPDATIPVNQLSLPSLSPEELFAVGSSLAPLSDQGVLIIGSGFFTHNLSLISLAGDRNGEPPSWSLEFDSWGKEVLENRNWDELLDFAAKAPAARFAHPTTEHFVPLFVAAGAAADIEPRNSIEGFWFGLSKRSVVFG
jgi:4,5-DOPA dioxygenase extradiol